MNCEAFIGDLLHASTLAHMLHFTQTGPGSFARHQALGELYDGLEDMTDTLTEQYMGCYGVLKSFPDKEFKFQKDPVKFTRGLFEMIENGRKSVGDDSSLQNTIDELERLVSTTYYKLTVLS